MRLILQETTYLNIVNDQNKHTSYIFDYKHILMFFAQCFCVKKKSKNERKSGHEL